MGSHSDYCSGPFATAAPPHAVNSLCIFCGSSPGTDPRFMEEAIRCGTEIARAGLTLVYGGGKVGLRLKVLVVPDDGGEEHLLDHLVGEDARVHHRIERLEVGEDGNRGGAAR